jgi:uncharacterized protein (DUF1778 family)
MKPKQKNTKNKHIQIRVTEDQHRGISAYAKSKDKKISEILVEYLDKVIKEV